MLPLYAASELASLAPSTTAPPYVFVRVPLEPLKVEILHLQGNAGQFEDVDVLVEGPTPEICVRAFELGPDRWPLAHPLAVESISKPFSKPGGPAPPTLL